MYPASAATHPLVAHVEGDARGWRTGPASRAVKGGVKSFTPDDLPRRFVSGAGADIAVVQAMPSRRQFRFRRLLAMRLLDLDHPRTAPVASVPPTSRTVMAFDPHAARAVAWHGSDVAPRGEQP